MSGEDIKRLARKVTEHRAARSGLEQVVADLRDDVRGLKEQRALLIVALDQAWTDDGYSEEERAEKWAEVEARLKPHEVRS